MTTNTSSEDSTLLLLTLTSRNSSTATATSVSLTDGNANQTQDAAIIDLGACGLDLRKAELPVILVSTLLVNFVALAVLMRMRGTCDTLDLRLVSLLNINDLMTTGIYTLMWLSGWASCDKLLYISTYCGVLGWLGSALVVWSAGIVVIMTSCRYLSLVKPLYYRRKVTTGVVTQGAVAILAFCLLFFIFPFTGLTAPFTIYEDNHICATDFAPGGKGVGQRAFIGSIGAIGALSVTHVVVCNFSIVRTLRKRNIIHSDSSSSGRSVPLRSSVQGKRRVFGHVTLVVSFVYVLCYAPFVIRLLTDTVYNLDHQNNLNHSISMSLLFLSPLLNPLIYGVFNKHFRRTLFSMFKLPIKKRSNQNSTATEGNGQNYGVRDRHEGTGVRFQSSGSPSYRQAEGSGREEAVARRTSGATEVTNVTSGVSSVFSVFMIQT